MEGQEAHLIKADLHILRWHALPGSADVGEVDE